MIENAQEMVNIGKGKNELKAPLKNSESFIGENSISNINDINDIDDDRESCCHLVGLFLIVFLVNLVLPGVGTMIIGGCNKRGRAYFILQGIAQLMLSILVIGWIWALLTSLDLLWKNDSRPYPPKKSKK